MKNILILSPDSPINGMGGLGVHLNEVLQRIDTTLYNVSAVCQGSQNTTLQDGKVKVFGLYQESRSYEEDAYINTFINQSRFVARVNELINSGEMSDPNIVHIMDWTTAIAGEELAKQFNAKIVFAVHLSINNYIKRIHPIQETSHRFAIDLEFSVCRKAHKIIHVTDYYANLFPFNAFAYKTVVVYNGVDYDSFSDAEANYPLPGNNMIKVVYVGRIANMKNVENIWNSVDKLPNIDFIFVGGEDGSDKVLLDKLCKLDAAEDSRVYYLGAKYGTDKRSIMASADIMIMPSTHEPFGLVALEALSAGQKGKTILCSSFVDGIGEFLTKESALNCGTTVHSIVKAINKYLTMTTKEKESIRAKGCELAQNYTWDNCAKGIQDVWASL